MTQNKNKEKWEIEFDKKFPFQRDIGNNSRNKVKSFILQRFISRERMERAVAEEMLVCQKEGTPTSRLTSLLMRIKD